MKNIVLVGFMGTGKSVVGKALAKQLKMNFINTDEIIRTLEKREIVAIFEDSGEEYFRRVEKEVVKEASERDSVVIAAGGGVVLAEENMKNLKSKGVIICLTADPEVIYARTKKHRHRPILNVEDPIAKIRELLDKRAHFYAKADYQVDTSGKSVKEVTEEIKKILNA